MTNHLQPDKIQTGTNRVTCLFFVARPRKCGERESEMKAIKSIIILLVAIPAMAVYALFEAINALAIEIDLVRIRTMMRCCRKFKTL